jgi:hypothetical protein
VRVSNRNRPNANCPCAIIAGPPKHFPEKSRNSAGTCRT